MYHTNHQHSNSLANRHKQQGECLLTLFLTEEESHNQQQWDMTSKACRKSIFPSEDSPTIQKNSDQLRKMPTKKKHI